MSGHANRPAGPAQPLREVRDAVKEQEGIDEATQDDGGAAADSADAGATDSQSRARQAERDAHSTGDRDRKKSGGVPGPR
jgi:hypothetical protein